MVCTWYVQGKYMLTDYFGWQVHGWFMVSTCTVNATSLVNMDGTWLVHGMYMHNHYYVLSEHGWYMVCTWYVHAQSLLRVE